MNLLTLTHGPALTGQGVFRLINMSGQTVYHQVLQAAPAQTLQLPQLPAGIYLYTWQSDGETAQGKLIRE
ncbi:MAG: T9SS type A sorting domain-containing protein [Mameliella sp.]|nr:T9SS type A sorting domain-containing protein [Phaeodactylibacter sp.]NRA47953.1 T9SS type A sorting domain-containing protein [Phaeodactylibacter sp.]